MISYKVENSIAAKRRIFKKARTHFNHLTRHPGNIWGNQFIIGSPVGVGGYHNMRTLGSLWYVPIYLVGHLDPLGQMLLSSSGRRLINMTSRKVLYHRLRELTQGV